MLRLTFSFLQLLSAVQKLILPFIRSADDDAAVKETGHGLAVVGGGPRTALVEHHRSQKLVELLDFQLPEKQGKGREGLLSMVENILKYSVNTWDQGYMHSLYSSTNAVSILKLIESISTYDENRLALFQNFFFPF